MFVFIKPIFCILLEDWSYSDEYLKVPIFASEMYVVCMYVVVIAVSSVVEIIS